jgi:hypothetical protein
MKLTRCVQAWNSPAFNAALIDEIQALGTRHPQLQRLLQAGLVQTNAVADDPISVYLLSCQKQDHCIHARVGVFYAGIISGCSCADDPSPVDTITEHCELLVELDIATGDARISLCEREEQ